MNVATKLRIMAATVMAIINWEPRVKVTAMNIELNYDGTTVGAATLTPSSISGSVTFSATSLAY